MKGLLVRVGADQSEGGGYWNGPVDSKTREFGYVAIPEALLVRTGMRRPFSLVAPTVHRFGTSLPRWLAGGHMHLDPDFDHGTYGDQGKRAKQIQTKLGGGDLLVFYAGLRDVGNATRLVYALIGLYVIKDIMPASAVAASDWERNAHTRRTHIGPTDIVVTAQPKLSGRCKWCIPVGEFRRRAYRVRTDLLGAWGGLRVNDGYLQRSARLPEFENAERFYAWFLKQGVPLIALNN